MPTEGMTNRDRSTILLVEADDATRTFLADNLIADGFDVLVAADTGEAHDLLERAYPDLAVIDAGLPAAAGLELLRVVREADGVASRVDPTVPVLILAVRDGELERVRAFEHGADDVLARPLSYRELRCRIEAVLRRSGRRVRSGRLRVGTLEIDAAARTVHLAGQPLDLSAKEFALLRVLAADPTRVFTKAELLRSIWGQRTVGTTRTLDSHACRLRRKLGADGDRYVVNVWGVGYRLVDVPAVREAPALAAAA
jgi:DNA-binding response OmpR family regulator